MKKWNRSWSKLRRIWNRRRTSRTLRVDGLRFEPLEERLALALTPTDHIHPFLSIFIDGQQVTIPSNIGLTPTQTFNPHTHDTTGKLHIGEEGLNAGLGNTARLVKLDDFFDVWRTTNVGQPTNNPNANFDSTHLLDKTADASHVVRMFVNGKPNTQFEDYIPNDGDRIVLSYESVVSSGTPLFAPIESQTVLGGSPLILPVDGFDAEGNAITYTISSSNPNLVSVSQTSGNQSLKMTIQQRRADNTVDDFGDMVFQLFQDSAPRPANRVAQLASSGFYNGIIFHRVVDNFVIQGGDPTGTGSGGSQLGNFDDQFNVDLQHNRTGLLSFAKSSDDTNNSQFFVTEGPQRHLDFNHSIFGVLIEGENVRDRISNVTVTNSKPVENVVISQASVFTDNQNTVFKLKAAEGASGQANITVTATDSTGKSFQRTFAVTVTPDTSNGGPFLNDIAAVRTTAGQAVTFQLTSQDVEGNAVSYTATSTNAQAVVSVTANGLVSVTPPSGFVGTIPVSVSVKAAAGVPNNTGDTSDVQLVNVSVAPAAPGVPDLANASDTGSSNTDNRTNLANGLQFLVSGVTSGATVELREGSTPLGSAVAGATGTVSITTNVALSNGAHSITAIQTQSGAASTASAALTVTIDSVGPTFSTTPPTQATVGTLLTYDANVIETATFSLVNAPAGATIDATTGIVRWTPTSNQAGTQTFGILATDSAGNGTTQTVNLNVADGKPVIFRLEISDTNGNPITGSIPVGTTFDVRMFAQDARTDPDIDLGLFTAYLDVTFDPLKAVRTSFPLVHSSTYPVAKSPNPETQTPGLLDEFGGTASSLAPLGDEEFLVGSARFQAIASGTLVFEGNSADDQDQHGILLYGLSNFFPTSQISYGVASVQVESAIGANADVFNVNEDSTSNSLNVLANDKAGSGGTLTITAVTNPNNGGIVSIKDGTSITYTPAPNFAGSDKFNYTVKEGNDSTTATVEVQVTNQNDAPVAINDKFTVEEDVANQVLDVLANDTDIDPGDALKVLSFTTPDKGGSVTIGNNGAFLNYHPAPNFNGTETFTYSMSDKANLTSKATVTISVIAKNDAPLALNDTATVAEDSTTNTIQVLSNDTDAEGDAITVTAVGTPANGKVSIAADKKSVVYVPNANFAGSDVFSYTASDATGSTNATVTVTVTNSNDPPTATADTLTARKNGGSQSLNVLANDSISPDANETLTISSVTSGSAGGTITVAKNGLTLDYVPAKDFKGDETFSYTIADNNGGQATATVKVSVLDFVPSTLSGYVFIDNNNDGIQQSKESPISGVKVTLQGTDTTSNAAVQRETTTNRDGLYSFADLAPGKYVVNQVQPLLINDGKEMLGNAGGIVTQNDQFSITLAENTVATNYSFAERGRPARFLSLADFTARSNTGVVYAALNSTGTLWTAASPISNPRVVSLDRSSAAFELRADQNVNNSTVQVHAMIPLTDSRVRTIGSAGGVDLIGIYGGLDALGFHPESNSGSGEGEASIAVATSQAFQVPTAFQVIAQPTIPLNAVTSLASGLSSNGVQPTTMVSIPATVDAEGESLELTTLGESSDSHSPAAAPSTAGVDAAIVSHVDDADMLSESLLGDHDSEHEHGALDELFANWI